MRESQWLDLYMASLLCKSDCAGLVYCAVLDLYIALAGFVWGSLHDLTCLRKQENVWHFYVSTLFSPVLLVLHLLFSALESYWNCQTPFPASYIRLYIWTVSEFNAYVTVYNMVERAYVTNHVFVCFPRLAVHAGSSLRMASLS